jgi:pyruvate,water dikinase
MLRNQTKLRRGSRTHADHLRWVAFPQFLDEVKAEREMDFSRLSPEELLGRLRHWIKRTLEDFARQSLQPSVYVGQAIGRLEQSLLKPLGPERAAAAVRDLLTGIHPDPEADLPAALEALALGQVSREHFLDRFGHRGPGEMELAEPRWQERDDCKLPIANCQLGICNAGEHGAALSPADRWQAVVDEAKLSGRQAAGLAATLGDAREYSALRETSKHYLMMGYALIRRSLVELGRRFDLGQAIFDLHLGELPDLISGRDISRIVQQRRQRRTLALSLDVPPVLFSDDLEAVGRPAASPHQGAVLKGAPVSAGVAEAPALVLTEPTDTPEIAEGFVLVCPSTDPAWVPLFLRAKALVMESGGILSHGAIVAREFNLPAVAAIPRVQHLVRTGQRLRVDGNTGTVQLLETERTERQ